MKGIDTRLTGLAAGIALLAFTTLPATALAEGIVLEQCANGGIAEPGPHDSCEGGWIRGNLNKSKAAYAENEFVPYRVQLKDLVAGQTYTYRFSWDTVKSGKNALDYIGSYDHSVTDADACQDITWTCASAHTTAIPADPQVTGVGIVPIPGEMTMFGGRLETIAAGDYIDLGPDVRGIAVTFTPDQENVVLTWGGHIASPLDWGEGQSASSINGSPYHTSNIALLNSLGEVVAGGSQDVQLSADAVFVPSAINVTKTANADGAFTFEADQDNFGLFPEDVTAEELAAGAWTLANGQTRTVTAIDDGTITITETGLPEGLWRVQSIQCDRLGDGTVFQYSYVDGQPEQNSATFDVDEASTFDCTFENAFYGAPVLQVIKKVIGPDDECTTAVRDSTDFETRSIYTGESVKYCYWVTNTGGDTALDVVMEDDMGAPLDPAVPITLSGLTDEDGDTVLDDLAVGGWASASQVVTLNLAFGTSLTNTAEAEGTGQILGDTVSDTDTATVIADQAAHCTANALVYPGSGDCEGNGRKTAWVAKDSGTAVNWCVDAEWDANAAMDLENVSAALQGTAFSNTGSDLAPGTSQYIEVGQTTPNADVTGTIVVTGSEGGINRISCQDTATVTVLEPGLSLVKLASTDDACGNGDDSDRVTIYNGDPVWYCLTVANTSPDSDLVNVQISDPTIGVTQAVADADMVQGAPAQTFRFGPYYPTEDTTNTATATGTEPLTQTQLSKMGSAHVTVLSADVSVDKRVDPRQIVLCDGINDPVDPATGEPLCTDPDGTDDVLGDWYAASYTIVVTNHGPSTATGVAVDDALPGGFDYVSNTAGCDYDATGHALSCALGDIEPAASVEITVSGRIYAEDPLAEFVWRQVTNQACANTDPVKLDPEPGNNCDDASTSINTGPTRTIGFWGNRPEAIAACLDASGGEIDLGFLVLRDETFGDEVDATVSTDPGGKNRFQSNLMTAVVVSDGDDSNPTSAALFTKGLINASPAKWGDGTQRSEIGQERVKAARQLTAAWCNEVTFGADFDEYYLSWAEIRAILAGTAYLDGTGFQDCGGACAKQVLDEVIASINRLGFVADAFNNSGDDLPIPLPPEPATPGAAEDDPTDPFD